MEVDITNFWVELGFRKFSFSIGEKRDAWIGGQGEKRRGEEREATAVSCRRRWIWTEQFALRGVYGSVWMEIW